MNEKKRTKQDGQSLVLVAAALVALVIFVAITVDVSSAYYNRRTAQNAADGAALAGVSRMATGININNPRLDDEIKEDMNDFAERNGIADTDDTLANEVNNNVDGYYVDAEGNRLSGEPMVGEMYQDRVPATAYGIEAITYITAPTYFGGIFGFHGYPLQARAVSLLKTACGADCVVPIITQKEVLCPDGGSTADDCLVGSCFNIWSESELGEPGSYGWVNWTWQELVCDPSSPYYDGRQGCPLVGQGPGCDADVLSENLDWRNCASGYIKYGDWVSNSSGIMNANKNVLCWLDYYLGNWQDDCEVPSSDPHPFTILVYDDTNEEVATGTCNSMSNPYDPSSGGLHYQVAGFAQMQILGYLLSQGGTNVSGQIGDPTVFGLPADFDPLRDCVSLGVEPHDGNRITALLQDFVTDFTPDASCIDPTGTLRSAPRLNE